jgi:hypothetical protein
MITIEINGIEKKRLRMSLRLKRVLFSAQIKPEN